MSTGWFEDKTALLFFTLYIFLWNFSPKPRPREKEPSQSWPTKLGSPFIARVEFPGESLRQILIYLPNCAVAMRKKSELRQHREHGRKQPKSIKIHQMGFKAYHFVFQCTIRSKSAEIPNVQKKNKLWRVQVYNYRSISPQFLRRTLRLHSRPYLGSPSTSAAHAPPPLTPLPETLQSQVLGT